LIRSEKFCDLWVSILSRYRLIALFALLILIGGLSMGINHVVFNADYREFFEINDPQRMKFDEIQDVFGSSDNIMFLLVLASRDVFTEEVFTAIHQLTERAWQIPHSYRVDSLTNYQYSWSVGDDLMVEDLLPDIDNLSFERLA
jgi:predicted RND superfamily exporter protein